MPILIKGDRTVFFAHIPKTAGTSIYLAFADAGWRIENLSQNRSAGSAFMRLHVEYGVQNIPQRGRMYRYPHPRQHAPYMIWRRWGSFDDSFAIVRDPIARVESAIKYWHRISSSPLTLDDYAQETIAQALRRPWNIWRDLGGHLVPQSAFVAPDTHVMRFEEDWQLALCDRYGLDVAALPRVNASPSTAQFSLAPALIAGLRKRYARDFQRFSYP